MGLKRLGTARASSWNSTGMQGRSLHRDHFMINWAGNQKQDFPERTGIWLSTEQ
jgi:hypothetical protein